MNKLALLAFFLALAGAAGCATDTPGTSAGSASSGEEPVTGSRLPPPKSRLPDQK